MDFILSKEEQQMLISSNKWQYLTDSIPSSSLDPFSKDVQSFRCSCKEGHKVIQKGDFCTFCGNRKNYYLGNDIVSGFAKYKTGKLNFNGIDNLFPVGKCVYVRYSEAYKHVEILLCSYSVLITEDGDDSDYFDISLALCFKPGEKGHLFVFRKGKWEEKDILSRIRVFAEQENFVFSGGNAFGFVCSYPEVFNKTGLGLILGNFRFVSQHYLQPNQVAIYYLLLASFYPGIERIVKMGYNNIAEAIVSALAYGKIQYFSSKFRDLSKLFKLDESSGKKSFTIPMSAISFLSNKRASYLNILLFCDFFSKDTSLNDDSFKKLSQTPEFLACFDALEPGNPPLFFWYSFMTLGKTLKQLVMYLGKQSTLTERPIRTVIQFLVDYMDMCKKLNVEIRELPSDLKKAHDSLAKEIHIAQNKETDEKILANSKRFRTIVLDMNSKNTKYRIRMPKCSYDLIQEGQDQNNCVGGYVDAVKNKRSTVFFIRKKDEPDKAFITAELKNGHLNQIFYKHNREVKEADILNFAIAFVEKARKIS